MSEKLTQSLLNGLNNPQYPTALLSQLGYSLSLGTDLERGTIHSIENREYRFSFVSSTAYSIFIVSRYPDDIVSSARNMEKSLNLDYDIPGLFMFLQSEDYPRIVMKFDKAVLAESYQEIILDTNKDLDLTEELMADHGDKITYDTWIEIDKQDPKVIEVWEKSLIRNYLLSDEMKVLFSSDTGSVFQELHGYPQTDDERVSFTSDYLEKVLYDSEIHNDKIVDSDSPSADPVSESKDASLDDSISQDDSDEEDEFSALAQEPSTSSSEEKEESKDQSESSEFKNLFDDNDEKDSDDGWGDLVDEGEDF